MPKKRRGLQGSVTPASGTQQESLWVSAALVNLLVDGIELLVQVVNLVECNKLLVASAVSGEMLRGIAAGAPRPTVKHPDGFVHVAQLLIRPGDLGAQLYLLAVKSLKEALALLCAYLGRDRKSTRL